MPEVSRFFGVIVAMNYNDHAPPHFHARYGNLKAIIDIRTLRLLDGRLPPRVFGLVMEWGHCIKPSYSKTGSWHAKTLP
jgi:hypothetical protein